MKYTILAIIFSVAIIGGTFALIRSSGSEANISENNVFMEDGKQIIEIRAKGGYLPRRSEAKAGLPTILRLDTNGTFDCSSVVRIPSMNISRNLPPTGTTDIDLGSPTVAMLAGTCGMGMYPFEIQFES